MQTATWLVSRQMTEATGSWDTRLLGDDDGEYFFRVIMCADQILFVPDAKVYYRFSGGSRLGRIGGNDRKREAQFLSMKLQISALRSRDDSPRVRQACLTYLQTWLLNFYPERPDIIQEAKRLAQDLGGDLYAPKLRWRYSWMSPLIGYALAKRAQFALPELRASLIDKWDRALFCLENMKTR